MRRIWIVVVLSLIFAAISLKTARGQSPSASINGCIFPVRTRLKTQDSTALSLLQEAIARGQIVAPSSPIFVFSGTAVLVGTDNSSQTMPYEVKEGPGVLQRTLGNSGSDPQPTGTSNQEPSAATRKFPVRSVRPLHRPNELFPILKADPSDTSKLAVEILANDADSTTVRVTPFLASRSSFLMDESGPILDLTFDMGTHDLIHAVIRGVGCPAVTLPPVYLDYGNFQPMAGYVIPSQVSMHYLKKQRTFTINSTTIGGR